MPNHTKRWCKYTIEYPNPVSQKTWEKAWAREVKTDEDINDFKRECTRLFLDQFPGQMHHARTTFEDGFENQPPGTKSI